MCDDYVIELLRIEFYGFVNFPVFAAGVRLKEGTIQ